VEDPASDAVLASLGPTVELHVLVPAAPVRRGRAEVLAVRATRQLSGSFGGKPGSANAYAICVASTSPRVAARSLFGMQVPGSWSRRRLRHTAPLVPGRDRRKSRRAWDPDRGGRESAIGRRRREPTEEDLPRASQLRAEAPASGLRCMGGSARPSSSLGASGRIAVHGGSARPSSSLGASGLAAARCRSLTDARLSSRVEVTGVPPRHF
jgi:hypothetical protein